MANFNDHVFLFEYRTNQRRCWNCGVYEENAESETCPKPLTV